MNDPDVGFGVHPFGFPQANVSAEAGHAVRINAPQVGAYQYFGGQFGLCCRTAHLLKNLVGEIEELLVRVYFFSHAAKVEG
jgi:hypothetical protein